MRCAAHPNTDTRLQCSQCERPICPKCMIACPVGYKCQACVNKTESHVLRVSPTQYAVAVGLGIVTGAAACWATATFAMGWSWMSLLLCYALGLLSGKAIQRASGNKLSRRLALVMLASVALGLVGYWGVSMAQFAPPGVFLYSWEASLSLMGPLWLHHALLLGGCWHGFYQGVRLRG